MSHSLLESGELWGGQCIFELCDLITALVEEGFTHHGQLIVLQHEFPQHGSAA